MSRLIFLYLLLPSITFAHGSIESIHCVSKDKTQQLNAKRTAKKHYSLDILSSTNKHWENIQLELKDSVENKTIIENISLINKSETLVQIKVPETVENKKREKRLGTAKIMSSTKPLSLDCKVKYL